MKQRIQITVLLLLVGALAYFGYQRIGIRMGGTPSSIQSEFRSEEQWFLETIVRDIANAAAYARDVPLDDVERELEIIPSDALELPSVRVHVTLGSAADIERTIALERSFWSPENYVALATELLGPSAPVGDASEIALDTLLEPTPATLLAENERLSRRLEENMRDAIAHEEAALLLGVFGLREAAFTFRDRRAVLLRMASHLALARAIRGDAPSSETGVVARALSSALAGRQKELREELASWPSGNWKSVLLTFSTEDWRDEAPSDHFLVQLMRFRALMATLGATIALERMRDVVTGNDAEWGRILASDGSGELASASYIEKQIGLELAGAEEVALAHFGRSLRLPELSDALNAHAAGMPYVYRYRPSYARMAPQI